MVQFVNYPQTDVSFLGIGINNCEILPAAPIANEFHVSWSVRIAIDPTWAERSERYILKDARKSIYPQYCKELYKFRFLELFHGLVRGVSSTNDRSNSMKSRQVSCQRRGESPFTCKGCGGDYIASTLLLVCRTNPPKSMRESSLT